MAQTTKNCLYIHFQNVKHCAHLQQWQKKNHLYHLYRQQIQQHNILRVYYKIQIWLEFDLVPEKIKLSKVYII